MRLIKILNNQKQAQEISNFLERIGISTHLDIETNKDWGSHQYGDTICRLWVIEEEQMDQALAKIQEYLDNPQMALENAPPNKKSWLEEQTKEKIRDFPLKMVRPQKLQTQSTSGFGKITTGILILCILLLMASTLSMPRIVDAPESLPRSVLLTPPVNKALMYDYPEAYTILDKIIKAYGLDSFQSPNEMSSQEQILIKAFNDTPYWKGFYEKIVAYFSQGMPLSFDAPLFEKIRDGQVWRLITPIFLHYDLFHLFFNMIWLVVIGKQIEERLGPTRYIIFIILTAIFSNTLQYLMGGPNFLGFSGVLCAMLAFIWMRQKKAAWEGYQMQTSTFTFIMVFIIAMFCIQLLSFFVEIYTQSAFTPGIANTAHLSGAAIGAFLGSLDFFAYKNR